MIAISSEWREVIDHYSLRDFKTVWEMSLDIVDKPNRGRGGWSEVGRYDLGQPVDGLKSVYIKRQENFSYRPLLRLWSHRPVCEREYHNLCWCSEHDIPTVQPLVYMQDDSAGKQRAILITAGLDDYISLSDIERGNLLPASFRYPLLRDVARQISRMHQQGLVHTCLYSKHIFVQRSYVEQGTGDIRFIDLEKARPLSWWGSDAFRDLDSLNRHAAGWSLRERLYFLRCYLGRDKSQSRRWFDRLNDSYTRWKDQDG